LNDARPIRSPVRAVLRIAGGVLGVPLAALLFVILLTLVMFPIGGGIAHLMFAYSPGGNLGGARVVFAGFLLVTVVVTAVLRLLRYPLPWYGTAGVVAAVALWLWSRPVLSAGAGDAFQLQGLLLAPLLPVAALGVAYWSERRHRRIAAPAA
jgi:hypothetical protein